MKIAITGHQNLINEQTEAWVRTAISITIDSLGLERGYTCLAVGADQIFAELLDEKKYQFVAVLACKNIVSSFHSDSDRNHFRTLLSKAISIIQVPFDDPSEEAYFEAGKTAVDEADIVLAVWNGKPAQGLGGTADIVQYARREGRRVIHIDLEARRIIELDPGNSGDALPGE